MYVIVYILLLYIDKLLYLCLFEDFFIIINIGSNLFVKLSMLCIEDRFYLC